MAFPPKKPPLGRTFACCLITIASMSFASLAQASAATDVATFAGSGIAGNVDGPRAQARFSTPAALAVEPNGSVVVVDKSLNTVREIDATSVRTIAGSSPAGARLWDAGGYRDGPALGALFKHPEGIAVASDGSIYIADTHNSCIRKLRAGIVTTVAGKPGAFGAADGAVANATFKFPASLALDERGDIFVADFKNGVREIGADGNVSTIDAGVDPRVTGIAYAPSASGGVLFVADVIGLVRYELGPKKAMRYHSEIGPDLSSEIQGGVALGYPRGVVAIDDHEAVFTDARDNAVTLIEHNFVHVIAGAPAQDPANAAGGRRDGAATSAEFFDPLAVTRLRDGTLAVADAGNHVLRTIGRVDDRYYLSPDSDLERIAPAGGEIPVGLIGNSLSWTNSTWAESIPGGLETAFDATASRRYRFFPVVMPGAALAAVTSVADEYLADGEVRAVVLQFNSAFVDNYGSIPIDTVAKQREWIVSDATVLRNLHAHLTAAGIRFVVALVPYGREVAPSESEIWQTLVPIDSEEVYASYESVHQGELEMLRSSGVPFVDTWPDFTAAEIRGEGPLFGTTDPHLSARGRKLLVRALATALPKIDPTDFLPVR